MMKFKYLQLVLGSEGVIRRILETMSEHDINEVSFVFHTDDFVIQKNGSVKVSNKLTSKGKCEDNRRVVGRDVEAFFVAGDGLGVLSEFPVNVSEVIENGVSQPAYSVV